MPAINNSPRNAGLRSNKRRAIFTRIYIMWKCISVRMQTNRTSSFSGFPFCAKGAWQVDRLTSLTLVHGRDGTGSEPLTRDSTRPDPTRTLLIRWPDPSLMVCALNWEIISTTCVLPKWMISAKSPWSMQHTYWWRKCFNIIVNLLCPRIKQWCCLMSVCLSDVYLSAAYIGRKSRTERPRKTKIGTEIAHVTRDSDTTFKVKRWRSRSQGRGILWRLSAQLVKYWKVKIKR